MNQIPTWAGAFLNSIRWNEPMSRHNTWHVGGPADCYFEPQSREQLQQFFVSVPAELPIYWIGLGSNVLIRDGGLRGVVISPRALNKLVIQNDGKVFGESGVPCARLAKECIQQLWGPAAFWIGIPGTVGGALAMNAGAWNGETWAHVDSVELINRQGQISISTAQQFSVGYRSVAGLQSDQWFLSATFKLQKQAQSEETQMKSMLEERRLKQPIGAWSGGSTFKNPKPSFAAHLIEQCGLKGYRVGGALVSEKHANFIINDGEARASDIEQLMNHIVETVHKQSGIRLTAEVRIMGEAA
jgi:UDP-N-acetylmuramate dehydrogenase